MISIRLAWSLALWPLSLIVAQLLIGPGKIVVRALPENKSPARSWLKINRSGN